MRSRRSELRLSCASAPPLTERERAAKEKELETLQRRLTETQQSVDLAKTTLRRMVGEQSRGNDEMTDSKSTGIAGNADTSSSGDEESVVVNDGIDVEWFSSSDNAIAQRRRRRLHASHWNTLKRRWRSNRRLKTRSSLRRSNSSGWKRCYRKQSKQRRSSREKRDGWRDSERCCENRWL